MRTWVCTRRPEEHVFYTLLPDALDERGFAYCPWCKARSFLPALISENTVAAPWRNTTMGGALTLHPRAS